jgi:hypothetical protein
MSDGAQHQLSARLQAARLETTDESATASPVAFADFFSGLSASTMSELDRARAR